MTSGVLSKGEHQVLLTLPRINTDTESMKKVLRGDADTVHWM